MRKMISTAVDNIFFVIVFFLLFGPPNCAYADQVQLHYDAAFSGDTPGGSTPWLTATFDDSTAASGWDVRLTLSAVGLVPDVESVEQWYFNLDPLLDPTALEFNAIDITSSDPDNGQGNNGIFTGANAFQADGAGLYDILFNFPPPPGQWDERMTYSESVVYDVKSLAGSLSASSFGYFSEPSGGQGTFLAAGHIQNTTGTFGSSWVGATMVVPEPVSSALFLLGSIPFGIGMQLKRAGRLFGKANGAACNSLNING